MSTLFLTGSTTKAHTKMFIDCTDKCLQLDMVCSPEVKLSAPTFLQEEYMTYGEHMKTSTFCLVDTNHRSFFDKKKKRNLNSQ